MIERTTDSYAITIYYKGNSSLSRPILSNNVNSSLGCYDKYNSTVSLRTFSMKPVHNINAVYLFVNNLPYVNNTCYDVVCDTDGEKVNINTPIFASIPNNSINGSNITYTGNDFTHFLLDDEFNQFSDISFLIKNDLGHVIDNVDYCLTLVLTWQKSNNVYTQQYEEIEISERDYERIDNLYEMNY